MEIKRDNYTVEISERTLYVDNKTLGRSGHMSHALAAFSPTSFIDFNSNCSKYRWSGHSPYGWVEYRFSTDSGKTYTDPQPLPYAYQSFLDGIYAISVEKAVVCDDGTVVAFCLRNSAISPTCCDSWETPTIVTSNDGGKTWAEPYVLCPHKGRIYDAVYQDGVIYAVEFCNQTFLGSKPEDVYRVYTSVDNGKSFQELSIIPFDTKDHSYISLIFDKNGNLNAYSYTAANEQILDHAISYDNGKSWEILAPCFVNQGARNPQIALIDGVYILHGRAMNRKAFVIYASEDGVHWSEACRIAEKDHLAGAFYSNNVNLEDEQGAFLLVQFSETYKEDGIDYYIPSVDDSYVATVNVMHLTIRIKRH